MLNTQSNSNADLYKIVRLTNKTDFDFTPEMGARYGGVPYFLPAGKSILMPKPAAKLLAKHLARQVFIKRKPYVHENEVDGKGSSMPMWTEDECLAYADTLLTEEFEETAPVPQTEEERIKRQIEDLNKDFPEAVPATIESAPAGVYADKAEVIAELTKRNIPFDARKNKAALEELLKD